jgi:hypothetical protein
MNNHQNAIFHQLDNFIKHSHSFAMNERPNKDPKIIQTLYTQKKTQDTYPDLTFEEAKELTASMTKAMMLSVTHNSYYIMFINDIFWCYSDT